MKNRNRDLGFMNRELFIVAALWQEQTESGEAKCKRMSKDVKTLDFAGGCNSMQNQLLWVQVVHLIRDREVGGSNPLAPTS